MGPLNRSHFNDFVSIRSAWIILREKVKNGGTSQELVPLIDDLGKTSANEGLDGHVAFNSKYHTDSRAIRNENEKSECLADSDKIYTESESVLLILDSLEKEKYLRRILKRFKALCNDLQVHLEGYGFVLQNATTSPRLLNLSSGSSGVELLEGISQHHCKGKIIIQEVVKVTRLMQRKLKPNLQSPFASKLQKAILHRWIFYNNEFQTYEDEFKELITSVFNADGQIKERLKERSEPFDTSEDSDSLHSTGAEHYFAFQLTKRKNIEIEALGKDLNDLHDSYQELSHMLLKQHTILDNIWHSVSSTQIAVHQGIRDIHTSTKSASYCSIV